jgi:FXSXX-COOH protein
MSGELGESASSLPDLTDVPLDEILHSPDSALAHALRRVLQQAAGSEAPISAYQSGAQFFPPDGDG